MLKKVIASGAFGFVVGLVIGVAWAPSPVPRTPKILLPVGPMVGHVTATTATIWTYAGPNHALELQFQPVNGSPDDRRSVSTTAHREVHRSTKLLLTDLKPGTRYDYTVLVDGKADPRMSGGFSTPPPVGRSARFKMAVSSCMKSWRSQSSFFLMLAERPAFHLLLGDNIYGDTTNYAKIWQAHLRQRSVREFAAAVRNMATYATWDDHDFASDGTAAGKENLLFAFKEVWANPSAGTAQVPGVFFKFSWADVEFFVLDGRYHRSPNEAPNDNRKRMLGDGQFQWLIESLKASTAPFKVIAQGSVLTLDENDGWLTFDFARNRLFRTIADNEISGVLWLSGDLHRCQVLVHPESETGFYDFYEIISSGIANSKTRAFVTLEFDTTIADPTVRIVILHGDATVRHDQTLRLSQLKARGH